jgi:hypothetical protein
MMETLNNAGIGNDKEEIESLKAEAQNYATCFHLISSAQFPGQRADFVLKAMRFLDDRFTELEKRIKALEPQPEVRAAEGSEGSRVST